MNEIERIIKGSWEDKDEFVKAFEDYVTRARIDELKRFKNTRDYYFEKEDEDKFQKRIAELEKGLKK